MPLRDQNVHIPFVRGVDTRTHALALEIPALAVCQNATFQEPGSISKRTGHTALSTSIDGGGSLSNITGFATRDDELVCFANGKVYSWSPAISKWVSRGDYEGVEVGTRTVCQKPSEQSHGDRADAGGVTCYAWYESDTSSVHLQLFDATTGSAMSDDTDLGANSKQPQVRVVSGLFLVFYWDSSAARVKVKIINPANVSGSIGNSPVTVSGATHATCVFDTCQTTASLAALVYRDNVGNHEVRLIDSGGTATVSSNKARTSDNPIAICYEPNLSRLAVVRDGGTDLQADILNSTSLADVATNITIEATVGTVRQVTAAFRGTAEGGQYRCVVFYGKDSTVHVVRSKYFMTNAASSSSATANPGPSGSTDWIVYADVCTKAFSRGGANVYVGIIAAINNSTTQRTVLLYREDGLIIARLLPWVAASVLTEGLPQVQSLGSDRYAFINLYRARVGIGGQRYAIRGQRTYSDKGLRDFTVNFASAKPFCGVQLGRTLYLPGGILATYDGQSVVESNFLLLPEGSTGSVTAGSGSLSAGSYAYRIFLEWRNNVGELVRSSYVDTIIVNGVSANDRITLTLRTMPFTGKRSTRVKAALVVYRTEVNDTSGVYYRVTSVDPTAGGNNGYVANDPTVATISFVDAMADTTLVSQETDPITQGGELDNVAPDPMATLAAGQGRLFAVGFENRDLVLYSKWWREDEEVAFNDALQVWVPQAGGDVVAVHPTETALVILKEQRVYVASGSGRNNTAQGADYGDPQLIPAGTGCSDARTVVQTPAGIMFQSPKGFCLLTPAGELEYVGADVEDYNSQTFVAALLQEDRNQVVFVASSGSTLAYDYAVRQWSTWTHPVGAAAVSWSGGYVFAASSSTVWKRDTSTFQDAATEFNLVLETPWIKFAGIGGFKRVRRFALTGKYKAAHGLRVRVAYDYDSTWVDDKTWTPDTTDYRVRVGPKRQTITSLKVRLEDVSVGSLGDSMQAVALSVQVAIEDGLAPLKAASSQ